MSFTNIPQAQQNGTSPYLSRQSSESNSRPKPKKHVDPPSPIQVGCCGSFSYAKTKGSTASTSRRNQQQQLQLEALVADLEKEVHKQTELSIMYKRKMEMTQDYLKLSLQIAQENGILDLIINYNKSPHSVHNGNSIASPQIPTHANNHHAPVPDLAGIIEQAKTNGWYIDPSEIQLGEQIGQGSTANIYTGIWRGYDVAVKCLTKEFFDTNANGAIYFAQELETLSKQRHRFVLQLMGACLDPPQHAWLVTEYLSTTLKDWIHGPGNNRQRNRMVALPPFKDRVIRSLEIAQAVQYLHEQMPKVIHRDLKPSNIFLDDSLHVRVADFGHARFLGDGEMALTGETGTYVYMAPEVIRCEPYNEKCDAYSFGVLLNELLTGNHPYIETEYGPTKIAMEVVEGKLRPLLPSNDDGMMKELIDLICLCWDGNPSIRPSFATITLTLKSYVKKLLH
ncbi:hypothetical protein RIF29_27329 [Crotalaria pallida]|uniref:Protein kinase domain-containing protein n=1 Tax=Crotalaria pallida TaxID=3830 RepID=A0AAN9I5G8_CROPI